MEQEEKPFVYKDFMQELLAGHDQVMVHLNNGVKLTGFLVKFDDQWIELEAPEYKASNCIINLTNVTSVSYK